MYYLPYYNSSSYKIDGYILDTKEKNDSFYSIATMTIDDIIKILPKNINNYLLLMFKKEKNLITALFETLKWCIKEKHIEL